MMANETSFDSNNNNDCSRLVMGGTTMEEVKIPHIEVREKGSALEIVLITGLDFRFMFCETIRLLHDEGAEVVNASFSVVDDTIFHSIHSKVSLCKN